MKALINELGIIEELVINRAEPSEIRPYILNLRTKLVAKSRIIKRYSRLNDAYTLLQQTYSELQDAYSELERKHALKIAEITKSHADEAARLKHKILTLQKSNSSVERQLRIKSLGC